MATEKAKTVSIIKKSEDPAAYESAVAYEAAVAEQKKTAMAFFGAPAGFDESKHKRRNMPMLIKPDSVPVDGVVSGVIVDILNSPTTTIKGKLIQLRHENGTEFCFPCTGSIRKALAPNNTDEDSDALMETLRKEIGKLFVAKRLPDGISKNYGGKKMYLFDVFTSEK